MRYTRFIQGDGSPCFQRFYSDGRYAGVVPAAIIECPHCDGLGFYISAVNPWIEKRITCDECAGSGDEWVEVDEVYVEEENHAVVLPRAVASL